MSRTSYFCATQANIFVHPRLPAPDYWFVCVYSVWFRSPTQSQKLQLCHKGHWAVYAFVPIPSFNPPYVSQWFSSTTLYPRPNLSLYSIFYPFFYSCFDTANYYMDGTASSSPPKILEYFLDYAIASFSSSHFLNILSGTAVSPMADNFVSGIFLSEYRHFSFLASLTVFEWEIPSSALCACVVLVVLENLPQYFSAAAIYALSTRFTKSMSPFHTFPP